MCEDSQIAKVDLPTAAQAEVAVETLRMLADPTRLRILWALFAGEQSVGRLAELVGVAPSVVSQHLAKLRLGRVVTTRREGNRVYYAAADTHVRQLAEEALFHADHVASDLADHPPTRPQPRTSKPRTRGKRA
jgi:DNA-binding transcriptional ArsR family regulator